MVSHEEVTSGGAQSKLDNTGCRDSGVRFVSRHWGTEVNVYDGSVNRGKHIWYSFRLYADL